jgi:ribosome maturation factor RimP
VLTLGEAVVRSKKEQKLLEKLEAAAVLHGFDLVDIERAGSGRNSLLRVFVDREKGLTLDDVAAANTWVAEVVEQLDPYAGSYTLEVSSPGIDRPLRTLRHFEQAVGEEVSITLETQAGGKDTENDGLAGSAKPRLKYTGVIAELDPERALIRLEANGVMHELDIARIKKARVKGRFDFDRDDRDRRKT